MGDSLHIGRGINGLGDFDADALLARTSYDAEGAFLDLGLGNGLRLVGLDAAAIASALEWLTLI